MTNREAHEEAAGYNLSAEFFRMNGIDPDAVYIPPTCGGGCSSFHRSTGSSHWGFCHKGQKERAR